MIFLEVLGGSKSSGDLVGGGLSFLPVAVGPHRSHPPWRGSSSRHPPEKYALKEKNLKFEYAEKCRKLSSKELIQNFVIFYDIKSNKDSK